MRVGSVGKRRATYLSDSPVVVRYCSKACRVDHWIENETLELCQAISTLAKQKYRKHRFADICQSFIATETCTSGSSCWAKMYIFLNGVETEGLLDTGAQVSIIPNN